MKHLSINIENAVATVTLNRPERHNAFNPEMISELTEAFLDFEKRQNLVAVVLRGSGKSFSAGGDLEWMKSMIEFSFEENLQDARRLFDMFQAMALCSLPVIGVVHGNVMGGGLGLVAVCDTVIADPDTQFCFSEARIGIAPAVISPWVLRKVPQGLIREVMLSARVFSADEALTFGLVHHLEAFAKADGRLNEIVQNFRLCAPQAVREAKKLLNMIASEPWPQYRTLSTQLIAERRVSEEGQDGLRAFLEKRKPRWQEPSQ